MAMLAGDHTGSGWPRTRRWGGIGLILLGIMALGALADWRDSHMLLINTTESLPNWAFVIRRTSRPARGDYVFFDPPASKLLTRHFGAAPRLFGKIVYGMPGDIVSHVGRMVAINGRTVGRMKPLTRFGEPLTPGATGPVPQGCYYVGTPHPDGFDSRYAEIGFACERQIVGIGEPIL